MLAKTANAPTLMNLTPKSWRCDCHQDHERNGELVRATKVNNDDDITDFQQRHIGSTRDACRQSGRNTQGVTLIRLAEDESLEQWQGLKTVKKTNQSA